MIRPPGGHRTGPASSHVRFWPFVGCEPRRGLSVLALLASLVGCRAPEPTTPLPGPPAAPSATPAATGGLTLVWSDEFDRPGLPDPARWTYEDGFVRNQELQYYTRERLENARVEDGNLVVEARKERFGPGEYTSASLTTKGRGEILYGRIEVRARLPRGRGMWPAIWLLGTNIKEVGWPLCGEIDIMENVGFAPGRIHANIHVEAYNHAAGTGKGASLLVPTVHDQFHLYALDWHPDRLDFFVDETKYFTFLKGSSDVKVWPFDARQYLILNIAVGGAWGGQQGIDDAVFPQRLLVDFVRVYGSTS